MNLKIKEALNIVKLGFRVFPVAGVTENGVCQCHLGKQCKQAGKHPIFPGNWKEYASDDPDKIRKWFSDDTYNVACVVPKGICIVDVDPKNHGAEALKEFQASFGPLPKTLTVDTGSGGCHLYFRLPDELKNRKIKNRSILDGVDIKTLGGYVIGPGSRHKSGKLYEYSSKNRNKSEMTVLHHAQLVSLLRGTDSSKNKSSEFNLHNGQVLTGSRNSFSFSISCFLRSRGFTEPQVRKILFKLNEEVCCPPLGEKELLQCVKSSTRYSLGGKGVQKPHYSLDDPCFNGELGGVVRSICTETEASAIGILVSLLTMVGSAIGGNTQINLGNISHSTNLYIALVGETAKGRKGTAYKAALEIAKTYITEDWFSQINTGIASGEGIIHAVKDLTKEDGEDSSKVKLDDKRLFIYEPEFAKVLRVSKRESNIVSAILRSAWDKERLQAMTKVSPEKSTKHHISLLAHITLYELKGEIQSNDIFNGFANRCLYAYVERERSLPFGGKPFEFLIPKKIKYKIISGPDNKILHLAKDAESLWGEIYSTISNEIEADEHRIAALLARATDQVLRISLIYAVFENSKEVSARHLKSAFDLWKYCAQSTRFIFEGINGTLAYQTIEKKILSFLVRVREASRTEIRDLLQRNSTTRDISQAGTKLVKEGKISISKPGRTEIWTYLGGADEQIEI